MEAGPFTGHLFVFLKKETRPCESALLGEERISLTLEICLKGPMGQGDRVLNLELFEEF